MQRISPSSVQHFVTCCFFTVGRRKNPRNPPSWRTNHCRLFETVYSDICIHRPYLQTVFPIPNLRSRHAVVTRDPLNVDRLLRITNRIISYNSLDCFCAYWLPESLFTRVARCNSITILLCISHKQVYLWSNSARNFTFLPQYGSLVTVKIWKTKY
jgi:hypothetical protein